MEVSTEELVGELQILERLSRIVEARRSSVMVRLLDAWLEDASEATARPPEAADG